MNKVVLVDHNERNHLLPLTFTRPVGLIRVGIFTIAEKWQKRFNVKVSYKTQDYLNALFPSDPDAVEWAINGALIPSQEIVNEIKALQKGESLYADSTWLATRASDDRGISMENTEKKNAICKPKVIDRSWKIFQLNGWAMQEDFEWLKLNTKSISLPKDVILIGKDILIEEGAVVRPCIINCESGPVFLAKGSEVMEGCLIRGGLALMEGAQLKMGAKI